MWQRLFQIVRYTGTDIQRTTACPRISCMMTNRASAKREPLIHQHQAGTRASCGPWAFHTVESHYIPAVDVVRYPQRTPGAVIPRHRPNRRHKWRLWASKEIYRRSMNASRFCSSATKWSYFIQRSFSSIHWYALSHVYLPNWVLNQFYDIPKDGLGYIISKADGDILDLYVYLKKYSNADSTYKLSR